jgi:cytochrome c oxidase subunit 2
VLAGLLILVAVVAAVVALAAAGITPQRVWDSFFPVGGATPATDRGQSTRALYNFVFYIAVVIFFIVEALIIFSAFRYRRKPGDDDLPPQIHGNNLVEVVWTLIPTVIVAVLFVFSWQTLNVVDAKTPSDIRITAVAARFQWSFDYLDATGTTVLFTQQLPYGDGGGMVVPVGVPVHVDLRSKDVIHAFYVPVFLFKRDVVPGKDNNFDFTVEEPGVYRGQCAELCGPQHGAMVFEVNAVDPATFQKWIADQTAKAQAAASPAAPSGGAPAPSGGAPAPSGGAPAPSGGAPAPSGGAPAPSGGAPAPSGAPSSQPSGQTLQLAAQNIAYSTNALQATADAAFTIHFNNQDNGTPHNVEIKDPAGATAFKGDIITGPKEIDYAVPPLKAGTYSFNCSVHASMTGTLTVQ